MDTQRIRMYENLKKKVASTPLYEVKRISIPNGNRVFAKEEWRNITGTHYDRIYGSLLFKLEKAGKIIAGKTHLIETTSGNAGSAFAHACSSLGYKCSVIIPENVPIARIREIRGYGAKIIFSPGESYIKGVVEVLERKLLEAKRQGINLVCPNHSRDPLSIEAMKVLGNEILSDITKLEVKPDFFITAIGNGISTTGIGIALKERYPNIKIIGVEPIEAPVAFSNKFPDRFAREFGWPPRYKIHKLLGAGAWGVEFPFLRLELLDDIILVKSEEWEETLEKLEEDEKCPVGRTSAACFNAIIKLASCCSDSVFLQLFYDPLWKYKDLNGTSNSRSSIFDGASRDAVLI